MESSSDPLKHHQRHEYCKTRSEYRNSKELKAVKVRHLYKKLSEQAIKCSHLLKQVYSVVNESKHLYVFGVPRINLKNDLQRLLQKCGTISHIENISNEITKAGVKLEIFTDCFHVVFDKEESTRKAKRFNDARNFMGGILHISYAFERESIEETRVKLNKRRMEVNFRMKSNQQKEGQTDKYERKRKCSPDTGSSEKMSRQKLFRNNVP